jgi:urease accessory protein
LDGDAAGSLGRAAIGGGACCVATLVHVAPGAEGAVDAVREALGGPSPGLLRAPTSPAGGRGVLCGGASGWDGLVVARILACDGASLRVAVAGVLGVLRGGRPLPRVWAC